jgi:predicted MFS family arabinose efflux permease
LVFRGKGHAAPAAADRRFQAAGRERHVVLAAFALFALARSNITELLIAMAILGFGVGSFSAAMPAVILAVTPEEEMSSAMSFNQVVRSVGFSLGSAVGGLVLSARLSPRSQGGAAIFP